MKEFVFDSDIYKALGIDADEHKFLADISTPKLFKKGEFILNFGQKCSHTFFIEKGLVRQFYLDDNGKEHIICFYSEGDFMYNVESVQFKMPSSYFVQALEDCNVLLITDEALDKLIEKYPRFLSLHKDLLYSHILTQQKRITQLLSSNAEDRYLCFVKDYPTMLLRVPQLMIASYLGITPESLSRVRKNLAINNNK